MRSQLHHLVREAATTDAGHPALTFKNETLSYGELWSAVRSAASGLRRLGLARGDRVAVYLDKRLATPVALFGTSAAGGVFVPVNPLLRPPQVAHILADCDVRVLVTTADRLEQLQEELAGCPALERVVVVGKPAESAAGPIVTSWDDLVESGAGERDELADLTGVVDADVAAILYTSGSTGRPKGVVLSHRNMLVGAESVSTYLGNTADDVILSALPLSFDAGLSQLTTAFQVGAHVVLLNYLLASDVVKACARYGVTGLTCVPPLWIQITAQEWPAEAAAKLRYFANTGGRMPRTTLDALRRIFPQASPFLMYGLTEAFRSTYLDPAQVDRRPDSIGKAIPNAEILVLRPDGSECAAGEHGELVHRGPLVSLGYWNDPEKTAARFRPVPQLSGLTMTELAVWSGDTVVRDEEGFLYFVGRTDEMIKTSGYRVSPMEVEEVAYRTGLVRDAVALGVPDETLGQRIVLLVTPAEDGVDAAAVLAPMRKALPLYMVPAEVVVREELPRSPNGKFDRKLLLEEATA